MEKFFPILSPLSCSRKVRQTHLTTAIYNTDIRAKAFVLDSKKVRIKTLDKIIGLLEQERASSMAASSSIDSYIELRESLRQEVAEEANRLGERSEERRVGKE